MVAALKLVALAQDDPRADLALDEALFRRLESARGDSSAEVLRLWESPRPVVVLGRSRRVADDVDERACAEAGVPVLRRASGGGTVLLGPGCLCYTLVLAYRDRPLLQDVAASVRFVLGRVVAALDVPGLERAGDADLALDGRKVSGNAQLRGRHGLLHHGTLLVGFPRDLVHHLLREPLRQPRYRAGRVHDEFMGDLPLDAATAKARLAAGWCTAPV